MVWLILQSSIRQIYVASLNWKLYSFNAQSETNILKMCYICLFIWYTFFWDSYFTVLKFLLRMNMQKTMFFCMCRKLWFCLCLFRVTGSLEWRFTTYGILKQTYLCVCCSNCTCSCEVLSFSAWWWCVFVHLMQFICLCPL